MVFALDIDECKYMEVLRIIEIGGRDEER